jgi:hypothetical protein
MCERGVDQFVLLMQVLIDQGVAAASRWRRSTSKSHPGSEGLDWGWTGKEGVVAGDGRDT